MKNIMGWVVTILIIAVIIVGFATSSNSKNKQTSEDGPIKVGFIGPLTGDAAAYGEPLQLTVRLAADYINSNGGINGRTIEFIYEDGKCVGKDAVSAMTKLVEIDKVDVVLGGFCSGESLAAEPIATKNKVLLFSAGSSSPDLTGISEYFVRAYPSDAKQGQILAQLADEEKGWSKVAVIQEQTDYSEGLYNAFNDAYTERGGTVVREEFASEDTDFRTILTKLKSEEPDALLISVQTPATGERVLRQLTDLDWEPNLMIADALASDPGTVEKNADILEGSIAAQFEIDADTKKYQEFIQYYVDTYGDVPPFQNYMSLGWDAALLLADGLREVGSDAKALAKWLREVDGWNGSSGSITINEQGDRASGHVPQRVEDGVVVPF